MAVDPSASPVPLPPFAAMTPGVRPVIAPLPRPPLPVAAIPTPAPIEPMRRTRLPGDEEERPQAAAEQQEPAAAPRRSAPSQEEVLPQATSETSSGAGFPGLGAGDGASSPARAAPAAQQGPVQDAIRRAAQEGGIDPAYALAVAGRESNFNPLAKNSKTIFGLFQMRGDLRQQHGVGDSDDPYVQAQGFVRHSQALGREMGKGLGRAPSNPELYLGHHFGGTRAVRLMGADPAAPVTDYFTEGELAINPHIGKAGTVGALLRSTISDIESRQSSYGAGAGASAALDPSAFGTLATGF